MKTQTRRSFVLQTAAVAAATFWRLKRALSGGGALMDVGIYALQATRYLTGEEPALVAGSETKTDPVRFREVDESVVWTSRFPSGAVAHCGTSYNTATVSNFRVSAEKGWFGLDPAFFYGGNHGRRSDGQDISFPEIDQFAAELDDFARCIEEKRPSRVRGEEGAQGRPHPHGALRVDPHGRRRQAGVAQSFASLSSWPRSTSST